MWMLPYNKCSSVLLIVTEQALVDRSILLVGSWQLWNCRDMLQATRNISGLLVCPMFRYRCWGIHCVLSFAFLWKFSLYERFVASLLNMLPSVQYSGERSV